MKALAIATLLLFGVPRVNPMQTKRIKSVPNKRIVSLDTVLSCTSDKLIISVFETDRATAIKLSRMAILAIRLEGKSITDFDFFGKQFVTELGSDDNEREIWPTDRSGTPIPQPQLSFCRYRPTASYIKSDNYQESYKQGPYNIDISGDDWSLNPNEVFAHADQFEFTSGVFTDSSRVFLLARKGRVAIQFLCKPAELVFYRAIYSPSR
jgi:hypothetical protein